MRCQRVIALAIVGFLLGACGARTSTKGVAVKSDAERQAIAADQSIRDAILQIRAMRPAQRDLAPLLDLLGTDDLRAGTVEYYQQLSSWPTSYEVDGRIDVVRQETRNISDVDVVVTTCERDWINMIDVNGARTDFRGTQGFAGAVSRTFRRQDDGTWLNVASADDFEICKGVPSPISR